MGREVRRVALDFDWPLRKPWKGFCNPHHKPCPEDNKTCFNGSTAAGRWLGAIVRFLMCAGGDGLRGPEERKRGSLWPHPYLVRFELAPTFDPPEGLEKQALYRWLNRQNEEPFRQDHILPPTPELAQLTGGLAERSAEGRMGHDSSDSWRAYRKIKEAAGVPEDWGQCPVCKGEAMDPAAKEAYEKWESENPPAGEGWQLWETVSEGSPITPVYKTAEELIDHMSRPLPPGETFCSDHGWSREVATKFVMECGWAPSMIGGPGIELVDGVTGMAMTEKKNADPQDSK